MKSLLLLFIASFAVEQISSKALRPHNYDEITYCGVNQYDRLFDQFSKQYGDRSKRIVNGIESKDSEWPWMVSLLLHGNGSSKDHLCGGTLITRRWVLTAAHCFESELDPSLTTDPKKWTVNVGEHNIKNDRYEDQEVDAVVLHPDRDVANGSLNVDIALVRLKRPVRLNKYVNVACLPDVEEDVLEVPEEGDQCIVAGWGHTSARNMTTEDAATASDVLRHAYVPIYNTDACADAYDYLNKEITPFEIDIRRDNICAGFAQGGTDSCQYDSGGPLMCYFDGKLKLSGIVSLGNGCAQQGYPGLYTDVTKYMSWVEETLAEY